jgi:Tol biopolymer transport system component
VANDKIGGTQIFVRDLQTASTTLVTANVAGTDGGNGNETADLSPSISADGRYVAFRSNATNLVTNDAIGGTQIFVRDLQQGVTTLVSVNAAGTDGGNTSSSDAGDRAQISADGGTVVFNSLATDLVPGGTTAGAFHLFARNLQTNTTTLVSVDPQGKPLEGSQAIADFYFDVTPDGRYIAFTNAQSGNPSLYVRDVQAGTTVLASVNAVGAANGNQGVEEVRPHLSADGRFVLFASASTDLVSNDKVGGVQLFVRDLEQNQTALVTVNRDGDDAGDNALPSGVGSQGDPGLLLPAISSDGRFVTFESNADNLVTGDDNIRSDVFQRDLQMATTQLVSARDPTLPNVTGNLNGGLPDQPSRQPSVSADGRYVAFTSNRWDLLPGAIPAVIPQNVFVRDLKTGITTLVSVGLDGHSPANFGAVAPVISANGRFVLFFSGSSNLTSNAADAGGWQLFVRDLLLGTTTLVSVNLSGAFSDRGVDLFNADYGGPSPVSISDDGRFVAFESDSDDLTTVKGGHSFNLFVRDLAQGTTTLASISADGSSDANFGVDDAQISGNGRFVAFTSSSTNLVSGLVSGGVKNVYVRDLLRGTTSLVNVNAQGTAAGNGSQAQVGPLGISDDGCYLAFVSDSTDLIAPGQNGFPTNNVFLRDLQHGVTTLVSTVPAGVDASKNAVSSFPPIISANGQVVAFFVQGQASDGFEATNLYVWNRQTGVTTLVSATVSGQPAGGTESDDSDGLVKLSADGRRKPTKLTVPP